MLARLPHRRPTFPLLAPHGGLEHLPQVPLRDGWPPLEGNADSRQEMQGMLTLEDM